MSATSFALFIAVCSACIGIPWFIESRQEREAKRLLDELPERLRAAHALELPSGSRADIDRSTAQGVFESVVHHLRMTDGLYLPSAQRRQLADLRRVSRLLDTVMAYRAA